MAEVSWEEITIDGKSATGSHKGQISIEWKLSAGPDVNWVQSFGAPQGGRSGSSAYLSGPDPEVSSATVMWTVPEEAVENANEEVKERVEAANRGYIAYLAEQERQSTVLEESADADRKKVAEAQARLDALE